jgi:hypothetical protein
MQGRFVLVKQYRPVKCLAEILCKVQVLSNLSSCFSVAVAADGPFWHKLGCWGCFHFDLAVGFPFKQRL